MTITRHAFTTGIDILFISHIISGCTDLAMNSGNPTASSTGPSGTRELVTIDQPDFTGVDLDHVSPDSIGIGATAAIAIVDSSRRQCLLLWGEGNVPTTTESGSGGHDPAGFRPTVMSVPTTGNTTVKGAVSLRAGGVSTLHGDNSDCYSMATRLSALGYHCSIVDYRVRPHTQAEAGCNLARVARSVRARVADHSLSSTQRITPGGYSAGGILCGEMILNRSGSASLTELDTDHTPDAPDAVSADTAATAMIHSSYGRLPATELDLSRPIGAVPIYYCYGTKDPLYDQFEAQAKVLAGSDITLRAHVLNGWSHGFGAEGGQVEECDAFLQQAFTSA